MTAENNESNGNEIQNGLKALGKGLKNLISGLGAQTGPASVVPQGGERSFMLRYNNESHVVKESDLPAGSTLPTIKEAFDTHAARLGIENGRERTYRAGESVADGNERVEWGNTYIAGVVRSTKG